MSVHNDVGYDILGKIGNRILLFRDKGRKRYIDIFDKEMKFLEEVPLLEDHPKQDIITIIPQDSVFTVWTEWSRKGKFYIKGYKYDHRAILKDSATVIGGFEKFPSKNLKYAVSKNKRNLVFFNPIKKSQFLFFMVDNSRMDSLWFKVLDLDPLRPRKEFVDFLVSNSGEANVFFEVDNVWRKRDKHHIVMIGVDEGEGMYKHEIVIPQYLSIDHMIELDDLNHRITMAGLISDDEEYDALGYYFFTSTIDTLKDVQEVGFRLFDNEYLQSLYGQKLSKKKKLKDFVSRHLVLQRNGGFVLVTEMNKEYYRRSAFNGISRIDQGVNTSRGWVDIYNDDIVLFAIDPYGHESWKRILFKKQFSQDDEGIYSSFFLFKTPGRLKFLYNDEIKRNNTASEYIVDPLGHSQRRSLLSTDYQNLKLRFIDAVQISESSLIIPSEVGAKLHLVKIEY